MSSKKRYSETKTTPSATPEATHQYSVKDYAKAKKLTEQAVRWQCKEGKLPPGVTAKKFSRDWIITTSELL